MAAEPEASRDAAVRAAFRRQADHCRRLGSPFTGGMLDGLAAGMTADAPLGARILGWTGDPVDDALALRVAGALHALARSGEDPAVAAAWPPHGADPAAAAGAALDAFRSRAGFLDPWLDGPPQTNETGRSGTLLGGLLALSRATGGMPVEILEIGASAGLNQNLDLFRHDLGEGRSWGPADSPVRVVHPWRGEAATLDALLAAPLAIADRAACDLNPLDPGNPVHRARLTAYVWADQAARLARAEAALALAQAHPRPVERADAAAWLEHRLLAPQPTGRARVVMHSIMWQYLPRAIQARIEAALAAAAARAAPDRPLARLRMEPDAEGGSAAVTLGLWTGDGGGGDRLLARTDFHGGWTEWRAGA